MAAIDIIRQMSNHELINYYHYCMVHRFQSLSSQGIIHSYHPTYKYNTIYLGNHKSIPNLQYPNEMFLLNEMWNRFINSSFMEQCWWKTKNIFQTKIDYPRKKEDNPITQSNPTIHQKEYIIYDNQQYELIGTGTKRKTYLSPCKTFVIKIPHTTNLGYEENKIEAETYKQNPNSIYAKCNLLEDGYLKMEYVKPHFFTKDDDYPDWILDIAETQVGYNLNNKLVAYDYGSEI